MVFNNLYFKLRDLFTPERLGRVDTTPNSTLPKWWTSSSGTNFRNPTFIIPNFGEEDEGDAQFPPNTQTIISTKFSITHSWGMPINLDEDIDDVNKPNGTNS
jgi:hypothetical protein